VRLAGRFLHERERHVFAVDDRLGPGFHVYTPLETAERRLVLVNRGFAPVSVEDPATRSAGQVAGEVALTGLVRRPAPRAAFVPDSEPARNRFYWPDYPGMLGIARDGGKADLEAVPFFVDADAEPANPGGLPRGGVTRLVLPNRHLEYALTWYGLALTLVGVFASFARSRLRGADQDDARVSADG